MTVRNPHHPAGAGGECLIERLRAGDDAAYEALVREHSARMLTVARRFLGCGDDSADAVQEAFASAFQAIGSFAGTARLGTWLHRIVVNVCLMKLRARSRRRTMSINDLLPTFDATGHHTRAVACWRDRPDDATCEAETRALVRACIDRLPEDYRTIVLLRDIEELDTEATAKVLGISPPAVKTRLHRARQALRNLLDPIMQY